MCYYWALIKCTFLLNGVVDAGTFVVEMQFVLYV